MKIKIHKSIHRYLSDSKYSMGLIKEEDDDENFVVLTFATSGLEYFARWLLMFLNKVEIIEPQELKQKVGQFVETLNSHYKNNMP